MNGIPAVVDYTTLHGELDGKRVEVPAVLGLARLLTTQRTSEILIPASSDEVRQLMKDHRPLMGPSMSRRIRAVDTNGALKKRVDRFFHPFDEHPQLDEATQSFFRSAKECFYHIALGMKYRGACVDSGIEDVRHDLHTVEIPKLSSEAEFRLSMLAGVFLAYEPFVATTPNVRGDATSPEVRRIFWDMLETTEFADTAERFGALGYVRKPMDGLRALASSVRRLVDSKAAAGAGFMTDSVAQLAGLPVPKDLMKSLGELTKDDGFASPMLDLSEHKRGIYQSAFAEFDPNCRPASVKVKAKPDHHLGTYIGGSDHNAFQCGEFLMELSHEHVQADPQEAMGSHQHCLETARKGIQTRWTP